MPTRELVSRDLRRLALGAGAVDYVLVRRRGRRGVGMKVDATGLTVSAPLSMATARVEALVRDSERWVLRKLQEWSARQVPAHSWVDGATLPYRGGWITLRPVLARRSQVRLVDPELHVGVRVLEPAAIARAVIAWYRAEALAYLGERALELARRAGLPPPRVAVSSARARWGSCNARGEIRLTWRLLKAPPELVDYVVCHELAHLRHMNHSPAFWAEVERQCPDHRSLRRRLCASDHLYRSF
jgi:predicted metal-dependent hydrolase